MKKEILSIMVSFVFLALFLTGCKTTPTQVVADSTADTSGSIQNVSKESSVDNGVRKSSELSSIKMINSTTGWAVKQNDIFRTTDGGSHWKKVTPGDTTNSFSFGTYYLDENNAWATASIDEPITADSDSLLTIFRTQDGGMTWQSAPIQTAKNRPCFVESLNFINPKCGWLMIQPDHGMNSEPGELFKTTDGGATWSSIATTSGMEYSMEPNSLPFGGLLSFCDTDNGWITGSFTTTTDGELYRTLDGGQTWQPQNIDLPANLTDGKLDIVTSPEFFSDSPQKGVLKVIFRPSSGLADKHITILYTTNDSGSTWQDVKTIDGFFGDSVIIDCVNSQNWWYWKSQSRDSPSTEPVRGTFSHSADGGTTWTEIHPDKTLEDYLDKGQNVSAIDFIDDSTGWILLSTTSKSSQELLTTTDGGTTWKCQYVK